MREKIERHLKGDKKMMDIFLEHCHYIKGDYSYDSDGYRKLSKEIKRFEKEAIDCDCFELDNPNV